MRFLMVVSFNVVLSRPVIPCWTRLVRRKFDSDFESFKMSLFSIQILFVILKSFSRYIGYKYGNFLESRSLQFWLKTFDTSWRQCPTNTLKEILKVSFMKQGSLDHEFGGLRRFEKCLCFNWLIFQMRKSFWNWSEKLPTWNGPQMWISLMKCSKRSHFSWNINFEKITVASVTRTPMGLCVRNLVAKQARSPIVFHKIIL